MIFRPTDFTDAYIVEPEPIADQRGFFARTFCIDEFEELGLDATIAQCSVSFNRRRGTLRGMHYQAEPREESKLVRCTQGAIYDVLLDLRPNSPTFKAWFAIELSAENRYSAFIPKGFAHGYQTLTDAAEVFYQISATYNSAASRGVRWNDRAFGIEWPIPNPIMSERDSAYPDFEM